MTSGFQSGFSTQIIMPNPFDDMGARGSYLARKSGFNDPGKFGRQPWQTGMITAYEGFNAVPRPFGGQSWQTGSVNTEIITPNRYDGFVPGRETKWGIGYGGDSWAETEMGFNGMSAFKPSPSQPVYRAEHYAAFAGDDEALADYESFDDCFDDGTRRMHLSSDSRGVERKSASGNYRKALFGAEKSLAGVGYMSRFTPQSGSDTNMARVLRPVDGAPQNRRWVFDPSTRRWHK